MIDPATPQILLKLLHTSISFCFRNSGCEVFGTLSAKKPHHTLHCFPVFRSILAGVFRAANRGNSGRPSPPPKNVGSLESTQTLHPKQLGGRETLGEHTDSEGGPAALRGGHHAVQQCTRFGDCNIGPGAALPQVWAKLESYNDA